MQRSDFTVPGGLVPGDPGERRHWNAARMSAAGVDVAVSAASVRLRALFPLPGLLPSRPGRLPGRARLLGRPAGWQGRGWHLPTRRGEHLPVALRTGTWTSSAVAPAHGEGRVTVTAPAADTPVTSLVPVTGTGRDEAR